MNVPVDAPGPAPWVGVAAGPVKLPAEAIFALLDMAPFGRLATYRPAAAGSAGRAYVVPLQFLLRRERLYLITRPGRKVQNLRAAPQGVCLQIDLAEPAGWTSVCAWGNYRDVTDRGERLAALLGSFQKYPARTLSQGVSMLRARAPGPLGQVSARGDFVVGALELTSVSGRQWQGLVLPPGSPLLRPGTPGTPGGARGRPVALTLAECLAVLDSRPLARLGCYHPARDRCYCVPLWFMRRGHDLWFYHPRDQGALMEALTAHPQGVCLQVDSLDCSPDADPAQPWHSVLVEGGTAVLPLSAASPLPPEQQTALLTAFRRRLHELNVDPRYLPPDPMLTRPTGLLLRLHMDRISGQATG
jgi:nitroimidazol reductase NimA-like FMN-containing flavoprotein (pyridoxamine 5'-phosphate oxidase superfamily)